VDEAAAYEEARDLMLTSGVGAAERLGALPPSALVLITLACAHANAGHLDEAVLLSHRAMATTAAHSRRDRQLVEILAATLDGPLRRAVGLAFEHFAEFGPDLLALHQLAWALDSRPDPRLRPALAALADQRPVPDDPVARRVHARVHAVVGDAPDQPSASTDGP
jgi:hypothetical protein